MFLHRILFSFQIVSFLIPNQVESSSDISLSATPSPFFNPSATATVSNTIIQVSMTVTTAVTNTSISQQPTPSTKVSTASSSVAASTSPPPSEGEQEAVVLTIADMKIAEFVDKKGAFIDAVKRAVDGYCSTQACTETSRKRRATTADEVYIVSGYPKASLVTPSDLLVAVFVSTGDSKFLSKNILLNVIQEYQGNVSSALERKVTGVGRLHFEAATLSPTESSATSGKTKLMYVFFGAFCGTLVVVALCIYVACWYGRRSERENDVRPLTTSNLELVDK